MRRRFLPLWVPITACGVAVGVVALVAVVAITQPSTTPDASTPADRNPEQLERGVAAYYAPKFNGAMTASGERLDIEKLTAAHRTLPFGTRVRVTNFGNGKSVVVRVIDRGPHNKGRVIDLSPAAAKQLDMLGTGVAKVELQPLDNAAVTRVE